MAFRWPPTRDMGAVLTLTGTPNVEQYNYCGFSFLVPFATGAIGHLLQAGVKWVPTSGNPGSNPRGDETNIVGYFIGDELTQGSKCSGHKCTPEEIKAFYDALKTKTNRPVGSIWVAFPPDSYYGVINQLDFAMIVCYPYKTGKSDQWALDRMKQLRDRIADRVTVPVIIIAQAEDASSRLRASGIAGVQIQHDYWYNAGFPVCWYSWGSNGTEDIARNFQALMHEWYAGGHLEEIIEDRTIVHSCGVTIAYQVSSFPENNNPLSCPHDGLSLGVEGIKGSEQIIDEPPPVGWVKPTGYTDPSGKWRNQTQLYDNIFTDDTGAYQDKNTIPEANWGDFIYLLTKPIYSNKIRIYPDRNFFKPLSYQIDIDVKKDGSWVDVFSGHLNNNVWNEKTFTPGSVTEARIRVYKYSSVGWTAKIKEFEFESLVQEVISTQTIICSTCGSTLELTVSSIASKNIEQFCPVCGEPACEEVI